MDRRGALSFLAGFAALGPWCNLKGAAQDGAEGEKVQWVATVLEQMECIKPGVRRGDLLEVFTPEGGLSTGLQHTYVSRMCPYFKVDASFRAVRRPDKDDQGRVTAIEDAEDEIVALSRPYLQFSVLD